MEWGINLRRNPFEHARIKLTVYYIGVMILIMSIFSFALIGVIQKNISDSVDDMTGDSHMRHEILVKTRDEVEGIIFTIDGLLLVLIGGMSYFLAGRTLKPIKKTFEMQKRFTADASHDLRTPLTIMKTEMEVALQSKPENIEKYKEVLISGLEEIETMSSLVEDLLVLARSEGTQHREEQIVIEYSTYLSSLVERTKVQAKTKNIEITFQGVPASIFVNEANFMRAVQNVLNNAVHHTLPHGEITITMSKKGKSSILVISDTGVGIEKGDLPHIFDRFYKASHSRNDETGSGLGLSIAKEFIERYKGTIAVTSELNKGTVVTVTMPLA